MPNLSRRLDSVINAASQLGPVAGTGSYQNGTWVDRTAYESALALVLYSTSGGVTGGAVKVRVEDALDGSGTGGAVFVAETTTTIPAGPNAAGLIEVPVDLRGARAFVRVCVDSDPTGGSPASIIAGTLVFGNSKLLPA